MVSVARDVRANVGQVLRACSPEPLRPAVQRAYNFVKARYDQHVYQRPSVAYREKIARASRLPGFRERAECFRRDGLTILPCFFGGARLAALRVEFDRLIRANPHNEEAARTNAVHLATGRLAESPVFSELAFEPDLLGLAQYYWGKPVVLNGTGGTRIEPLETADYGSYQWHHDGKRKQVRILVLLTDVPEDGQRTDVVVGSNHFWYEDLSSSRVDSQRALAAGPVVACAASAGSVVIFDTNAIHRGNRNKGPRRDTWNFALRAPNSLTTALARRPPLHPDVVATLTAEQRWIARLDGAE